MATKHFEVIEKVLTQAFSTLASTLIDLCFLVTDLCLCTEGMGRLTVALVRQRLRVAKMDDSARAEVWSQDLELVSSLPEETVGFCELV